MHRAASGLVNVAGQRGIAGVDPVQHRPQQVRHGRKVCTRAALGRLGKVASSATVNHVAQRLERELQTRTGQEVQQLQGEEQRNHQHHQHVVAHAQHDVVDELGVQADVQHPQRPLLSDDRQRNKILLTDPPRLKIGLRPLQRRQYARPGKVFFGASRCAQPLVQDFALRVGDGKRGDLGDLGLDFVKLLFDTVQLVEPDVVLHPHQHQ